MSVTPYIRRIPYLCLTLLVAACGSSGGSSSDSAPAGNTGAGSGTQPPAQTAPELSSVAPQQFTLELNQGASDSLSVSFSNSGDAALSFEVSSADDFITVASGVGTLAPSGTRAIDITFACANENRTGSIVLETNDSDEALTTIPVTLTCLESGDYEIQRVTLNQAARSFDSSVSPNPSISGVLGRELLVRAFVTGSGLAPSGQVIVRSPGAADQTLAMQAPIALSSTAPSDGDLAGTFYAVVPENLVVAGTEIQVVIDPSGTPVRYPQSGFVDLAIEDPGRLNVTFVPVTYNAQTPTINAETYFRQTREQLPIGDYDLQVRAPYVFTGDYDLDRLLDEMADLRTLEGSTRLYHGIIEPENLGGGSQSAGLGFVSFPVSVSIDLGGTQNIVAHEIGHNLSLRHAPGCGAPNADPDYPHPNADVVSWGFNITTNALVSPNGRQDLMSYCPDLWISDFHFQEALSFRVGSPTSSTGRSGVLFSGRVTAGGVERLSVLPTDRIVERRAGADDTHVLRAWDASGRLLAEQAFSMFEVGDAAHPTSGFSVQLPIDMAALHYYEISDASGIAHSETLAQGAAAEAHVSWDGADALIRWQTGQHAALIVRDDQGVIRSVDRTGRVRLADAPANLNVSLSRPGRSPALMTLRRGVETRRVLE